MGRNQERWDRHQVDEWLDSRRAAGAEAPPDEIIDRLGK
jgi:hypothetical protein